MRVLAATLARGNAHRTKKMREREQAPVPNKFQILIVEDDTVFRRGLARIFSADQFEVAQASDGEQALALLGQRPLDLIICDFRLPGINGMGVLNHAQQVRPRTPFLMLTAYYSEELLKEATAQGAVAVLEKPIELKLLRERCTEILQA